MDSSPWDKSGFTDKVSGAFLDHITHSSVPKTSDRSHDNFPLLGTDRRLDRPMRSFVVAMESTRGGTAVVMFTRHMQDWLYLYLETDIYRMESIVVCGHRRDEDVSSLEDRCRTARLVSGTE